MIIYKEMFEWQYVLHHTITIVSSFFGVSICYYFFNHSTSQLFVVY